VLHALESLDETFTHVLLLQPTSPLRTSEDIDGAIDTSLATGADAVIGVSEAKTHPYLTYGVGIGDLMSPICRPDNVSLRRQDLPPAYELNGAIYMNAVSSLLTQRTFLPANSLAHVMPVSRSIDIDLPEDWTAAEQRLSEKV
jgi:N-acylneuraminate cytidylyltransferase